MDVSILVDSIKVSNYQYEENYLESMEKFFKYVTENIFLMSKKNNAKYWLEAKDIIKSKSADPMDLAILTCSIMHALGDFNARVYFVELSDYNTFAYVKTKYKNRVLVFDPFNSEFYDKFLGYEDKINLEYRPFGKEIRKVIYEFNAFEFDS